MNEHPRLLDVRGLSVRVGGRRVVEGVDLSVRAGRMVAVVGESGSGKSVTALSVLRLLPMGAEVERGEILLQGREGSAARDVLRMTPRELRQVRGGEIAMIFQEPMTSLNPVFTIGEQIVEAVRLHSNVSARQAREIAAKSLEGVGIPEPAARLDEYPHEWSGGMRQRAMIAMAMACEPRLLIADEPTTALDATVQAQVLDVMDRQRSARGLGVLLISHDLGVVARRSDEVHVMLSGRVVERGPAKEVFEGARHPYTRELLASRPSVWERKSRLGVSRTEGDEVELADGTRARAWTPEHAMGRLEEVKPGWFVRVEGGIVSVAGGRRGRYREMRGVWLARARQACGY